jgi:hypothetical protein
VLLESTFGAAVLSDILGVSGLFGLVATKWVLGLGYPNVNAEVIAKRLTERAETLVLDGKGYKPNSP